MSLGPAHRSRTAENQGVAAGFHMKRSFSPPTSLAIQSYRVSGYHLIDIFMIIKGKRKTTKVTCRLFAPGISCFCFP